MVTHEPDMAAYAGRMVEFVDGQVTRDHAQDNAGAGPRHAV